MVGVSAESHPCYDRVNWHELAGGGGAGFPWRGLSAPPGWQNSAPLSRHYFEPARLGSAPGSVPHAGQAQPALRSLPRFAFGDLAGVDVGGVNRLLAPGGAPGFADLERDPEPPSASLACLRLVWSR